MDRRRDAHAPRRDAAGSRDRGAGSSQLNHFDTELPQNDHLRNASNTMPTTRTILAAFLAAPILLASPAFAQAESAPAAPAAPAVALPPAAEILEKATAAIGGKDAWAKHTSMKLKGSMEVPLANIKGPMTTVMGAPTRMSMTMELPGLGVFRTGYDGKVGWASDKMSGPRLMAGKELETIARDADYFKDLDIAKRFGSVETVGEGEYGGFQCWKLLGKREKEETVLWIEKDTFLTRGMEMTVESQMGKIPVKSVIKEYREIEGIKLPVRTETTQMGQKMVMVVTDIELGKATDADFELPAEVKALLEPEPADEEPAAPATPAAPAKPVDPTQSTPTSHPAPTDPKN